MKKLLYSLFAKIMAVILFFLFFCAMVGGGVAIVYMSSSGLYDTNSNSFYNFSMCDRITSNYVDTIYYQYFNLSKEAELSVQDAFRLKQFEEEFSKDNTNFFFTVTDENGKVLLSNYVDLTYGAEMTFSFSSNNTDENAYVVNAYVKNPITAKDDYYTPYQIFSTLYSMRYIIIVITALSAILTALLFIFLLCSAGHRKGNEGITLSVWDKIPFDLYSLGILVLCLCVIYPCYAIFNNFTGFVATVIICLAVIIVLILALTLCLGFAVRVKAGKWWENTVIFRVLKWFYKFPRFFIKFIGVVFANLPLLWKTILLFGGYIFINFIFFIGFMDSNREALFFIFGLLFNLFALSGLCYITLELNRLKRYGEKIAEGDYSGKIDTKYMLWEIKTHAETLNNIGLGMSKAVEARLKSEHLKTELITNVSHDIKTPLTSIVNYVDLIKKEHIENENVLAYIEVLDRQSARLKKLTEDLLEASKASTGNITVNSERTDVVELLNQSIGEYAERFLDNKLDVVFYPPEKEAVIIVDGRLLWRVFDNLLNNICKYAMPNTRIYIDVVATGNDVMVTLKNISKNPLNITVDELLERFVRGDSSRSTEGNGLGLSIAKSLTELQKGSFNLSVDGDLFKVIMIFELMK